MLCTASLSYGDCLSDRSHPLTPTASNGEGVVYSLRMLKQEYEAVSWLKDQARPEDTL